MTNNKHLEMFSRLAFSATMLFCLSAVCNAQVLSQVAVSRAATSIAIDGVINETAWNKAARVSNFGRCDASKEIAPPDEQTYVYMTYDSTYLYLAFRCFQNTEKIVSNATQRDGRVFKDDSIEFYLLFNSSEYFIFGVNSQAVKYDADVVIPSSVYLEWNPNWSVATKVYSTYWDAEIAIPLANMGVSALLNGTSIRSNFIRHLQTDGEKLSWGPSDAGFGYSSAWSVGSNPADFYDAGSNWGTITFWTNSAVARLNQYSALDSGKLGYTGEIVNNTSSQVTVTGNMTATYGTVQHPLNTSFSVGAGASSVINQMYDCTNYQWRSDTSIYSGAKPILLQSNYKYNPECLSLKKYFFESKVEPVLNIQGLRALNPTKCQFNLYSGSNWIDYVVLPISIANSKNLYSYLFNILSLPAGGCSVSCTVWDANNAVLYTKTEAFNKPTQPAWQNNNLGMQDVLLAPWTPVLWNGSAVSCWGRNYQFNNNPVPVSVTNQGQELLASPMTIKAVINGAEVTWTPQSVNATSSATKATLATVLTGSNATLTGTTQVEFDGMARIDLNLTGRSSDTLTSLTLEIPLRKDVATLLLADPTDDCFSVEYPFWRGARNGLIPSTTVTGPFTPYLWMGNDKLGLVWFAESQKNWSNLSWDNAIEIVPQSDRVILRVKFVDSPISLSSPLALTFGLQATPVKPIAQEKDFLMYTGYGQEWPCLAKDMPGNGSVTYPADGNISLQQGTVHVWTTANFDANLIMPGVAAGFPRFDDTFYTIFSVEYPSSDMFGLYWDASDAQLKLIVRKGDIVFANYPVYLAVNCTPWMRNESRLLSVTWSGSTVSVYVMGVLAASGTFNPGFINTLEPAVLRLGGPFSVDAVKITNNAYSGGDVNSSIDANTLFLDHFRQIQGNVTIPDKSYNATTGTLSGNYLATNATTMRLNADKKSVGWFELWSGRGKDIAHIHENWTETQGLPYTNQYANQLTAIVNGANAAGMQFMPYIGFAIGDNSTEYQTYKDEIVVEPWVDGHGWHRQIPPQVAYHCNYSGQWQNFMVYYIEKLIREKGVGGFYFDGTSIPLPDKNLHNGTGYYDRNGTLRPSYPIFEYRKLFKRIRTIAQQYDPDFWMDIHTTVGIWTPVASFADSYWCGEQFEMMCTDSGKALRDAVPLDVYRAWFGKQFGLDGYFLSYSYAKDAETVSLLHDTPLRVVNDPCLKRAKDKFGVASAMWHGYYENSSYISSSDTNVKVSFYQKTNGDTLFVMANLGTLSTTTNITILTPLRNLYGKDVRDAVSMERITHTDSTISVSLEPWRVRLILVKNQQVAPRVSIGEAKKQEINGYVYVEDVVVTDNSIQPGYVFVESKDRSSGIILNTTQSLLVGQKVTFTGTISRVDGEYQVGDVAFVSISNDTPLAPVGMIGRSIGNDPIQILNYVGINTVGLLVRLAGRVTGVDSGSRVVYVEDGSNYQDGITAYRGVRVEIPAGVTMPMSNDYICVTGISRVKKCILASASIVNGVPKPAGSTVYVPSVCPRNVADINTY